MKIIVTCHSYYPRKDGVQFVTQYIAEGLAKRGHTIYLYTNFHEETDKVIKEIYNGVEIHRIKAKTRHTFHLGDKENYKKNIKEVAKKCDVMINVCTQCATTDWLLSELDNINIPKILYLHGIWNFKLKKEDFSSIKNFLSKVFCNIRWSLYYKKNAKNFKKYNVITKLHTMDESTNDYFEKKLNIKCIPIENAAENSFFDDSIDQNIKLPNKYILNVSNYYKVKNQMRGLEIFLNSNITNDWEYVFMGSKKTDYYHELVKKYDEYKKNGGKKVVHFLHDIPRKDVPTYVKKASIYMMTSKWEAFPISLVESIAAGVPFISSNVGIVRYIPGGVVCNSDEDYIYWLNEFCNNEYKRKKYGNLGKEEAIQRFSIDSKVDQIEKVLEELINENK